MSTRYKITDPEGLYFLTLTTVGWLDVFTRKAYKDILIESLRYCQGNKGLLLYAYTIMSNHLHLIAQAGEGAVLVDILRDFKKFAARQIIDQIQYSGRESRKDWLLYQMRWFAKQNCRNQEHQLWQPDNHPEELISPKFIYQKLAYIHNNAVEAGLVKEPAQYVYSSAAYYENGEGILPVIILDLGVTEGYVWLG
ncbi:MAG: transposase [Lewinellaceae bacterium]|nr:transposase [Lewinellaceae bacterium]